MQPVRIEDWYAPPPTLAKMRDKHRVYWDEVVDIMEQDLPPRRTRSPGGHRRYYVVGRTQAGRPLKVIFELEPPRTARVITAYEFRP